MRKQTFVFGGRGRHSSLAAIQLIYSLDKEKTWEVTVAHFRKKRSLPQNAVIHMWFGIIADETGDSPESVKSDLKAEFSPMVQSRVTSGKMRPKNTSEMNTLEMKDFMDRIMAWSANFGIVLPHPDDYGR